MSLLDTINSATSQKSLSGKVSEETYKRFDAACMHLGLNRNKAVAAACTEGLTTLEAACKDRPAKPPRGAKAKAKAAAAAAVAAGASAEDVFGSGKKK